MSIFEDLKILSTDLKNEKIDHALIGALALGAYATQRSTADIDILVDIDDRPKLEAYFKQKGYNIYFESPDVLQVVGVMPVDTIFARRPLSKKMMEEAKIVKPLGIKTVGPEDLIGLKIQAYSNDPKRTLKDKADIEALIKHCPKLDWNKIKQYADIFDQWSQITEIKKNQELQLNTGEELKL